MTRRRPLTQDRIVEAAVKVADEGGVAHVSMRNVAKALGVEAMSLYHHLAGKDALLDALANWVFTQFEHPEPDQPWREAMTARAASARRALAKHPWAIGLLESRRTPGPALLRHHEAVLACLRRSGFSFALASHAHSALDAYVFGFVLTEVNLPFEAPDLESFAGEVQRALPPDQFPHLAELISEHVVGKGYRYADEFGFGLGLLLDGLERHLEREQAEDGSSSPHQPSGAW